MAALTLTAGAPPIFLNENYLNRFADENGDLVVSSFSNLRHRLYDMVPASPWYSEDADDTIAELITAGLWLETSQVERDVDFIALLNHNLLSPVVSLSKNNGSTYPDTVTFASQTTAWKLYSFSSPVTSVNKFKLDMLATQAATPNAQKRVGDIVVTEARFQASKGMSAYAPTWEANEKSARMGDGSTRYAVVGRADVGNRFYRASVSFRGLSITDIRQFEDELLDNPDPFLFVPEPGDRPDIVVLCRIVPGSWRSAYLSQYRGAGFELSFDVEEIGGM